MKNVTIRAAAGGATVHIYDEIGSFGFSAREFIAAMKDVGAEDPLTVRINSPGGDLFDGLAIYNVLRSHPGQVTVLIDGIAASAASIIAMAGTTIEMPENTFMFVHDPSGLALGTAKDMRDLADALDKMGGSLAGIYAARTGLDRDDVAQMMADETWLTAEEAVELGFADEMMPEVKIAASVDLSNFKNVPRALREAMSAVPAAPSPTGKGGPKMATTAKSAGGDQPAKDAVQPQPAQNVVDIEAVRAEGWSGATDVVAECSAAGFPELAQAFLDKRTGIEAVKARLAECESIRAAADLGGLAEKGASLIAAGVSARDAFKALGDAKAAMDEAVPATSGHHAGGDTFANNAGGNYGWDKIVARTNAERAPFLKRR